MDKDNRLLPANPEFTLETEDRSPEGLERRRKEIARREAENFNLPKKESYVEVIEKAQEKEEKRKHRASQKDPRLRSALLTASVAIQDLELIHAFAHAYYISVSELVRDAMAKRMNVEFAPIGRRRAYRPRKEIGRHIMREMFEGRANKPLKL